MTEMFIGDLFRGLVRQVGQLRPGLCHIEQSDLPRRRQRARGNFGAIGRV